MTNRDGLKHRLEAGSDSEVGGLESLLHDASEQGHDDFLDFLLGDDDGEEASTDEPSGVQDNSRIRLLSNAKFLEDGYRTLAGGKP